MGIIDKALEELEENRKKILAWTNDAKIGEEAVKMFEGVIPELRVSIGWNSGSLNGVLIFADVDDLKDMIPLLKWLQTKGYKPKAKPDDYPEIGRRLYNYGSIQVGAFLREDSTCHFEKVGVKEVPVYKVRCGDKDVENLVGTT